jgi:DNA replication and repair protein RecF
MRDRSQAVEAIAEPAEKIGASLGVTSALSVSYRPRSRAPDAETLAAELRERIDQDIEHGFSGHGPHRDELALAIGERDLRAYGSQGQQRIALLALLLAEREAICVSRGSPPVMLLDDVMSELDGARRSALIELLRAGDGQAVITTTDLEHVPGAGEDGVVRLVVADGGVLEEAIA